MASRQALFRVWQSTVVLITAVLVLWSVTTQPLSYFQTTGFIAVLVLLATFLRIEAGEASVGFDAAIVFGAIIVFHDPGVALVAVALAGLLHGIYTAASRHRITLESVYITSHMALGYAIMGLLYTSAVARDAAPMAKVSGFILLVVGYLVIHLLFASLRGWFETEAPAIDFRLVVLVQGRTLLFVSPIVAVEVMLFRSWGMAGFAVAFLPVLLVAYAMRNEADARQHNVELVRRNRELALLTESSTQILAAEGDQETLRRLTSLLSGLARLKACAIVTWETTPDVRGVVYRFGDCLPTDQDILRWVDSANFVESAPSRPFVFQDDQRRFPLSGSNSIQILIGIQTAEVIYGILIFETDDRSVMKVGSLNLIALLVHQTALSLQDQLLRRDMREKTQQLERQAATMDTILATSNSLIGSFDVEANLTMIAEAIRSAVGFKIVIFALYDSRRDVYLRRAHAGMDEVWDELKKKPVSASEIATFMNPEFRISHSFFVPHTALRQSDGNFFVVPEDEPSVMTDEWHENDMLLVPMWRGDDLMGYLSLREPHDRRRPNVERVRILEVFAVQAVTALESAKQYDEIKRLTTLDSLTGAFNHRHFQDSLAREIHRHARTAHEFALAMLDIDNFKKVNDSFGHPVGDVILKGLVEELMSNARDTDVVARYGGEEFAIIFSDTPASKARDAAERLRELIARREFAVPQLGRTLRITVSIGVAICPMEGENGADLVARADEALYVAKKNGKNQVVMAADLVDRGAARA
jgi:diguanylate cyclase (GGDEF)-like protein